MINAGSGFYVCCAIEAILNFFFPCVLLTAQNLQIGKVLASLKYSFENNAKLICCGDQPQSGFGDHCIYFCRSRSADFGQ